MLAPAPEVKGGMCSFLQLVMRTAPDEVEVKHIPTWSTGSGFRRFLFFAVACLRLLYLLVMRKTDIIHLHFAKKGSVWRKFILARIASLFHRPVLLHAHSGAFPDFYRAQKQWQRRWIARTVQNASRLIVLTEQWRRYYCEALDVPEEQVVALPNPVKLPAQLPARAGRDTITFVFLGRIDENKGAYRIIQAASLLPAHLQQRARFILAGDGDVEVARQQAQSLNLPQVAVLGWVEPSRREALLAEGDVLLLPSLREGLPMSILEAMSWGLPVITSPVGGIPEVVRDGVNGLLVPPMDVPALCKAIQQLIEDETLRLQMGDNARASVEHLDIHRYWQRLLEVYRCVLQAE
ncbi:MAG: glycosyltransferase family 4 protein [Armatimonadota bacterium]